MHTKHGLYVLWCATRGGGGGDSDDVDDEEDDASEEGVDDEVMRAASFNGAAEKSEGKYILLLTSALFVIDRRFIEKFHIENRSRGVCAAARFFIYSLARTLVTR